MNRKVLAPVSVPAQRAEPAAGLAGAARGGLGNLAGAVVAGTAGLGVTWLVARGLGPAAAGSFFAATSAFVLFSSIARLGTSTALVYWPARLRAQGRPELIASCLRAGLIPVAILSTALGVALWTGAPVWFPAFEGPLRALSVLLPLAALAESLLAATRGYRMMRPTVLLDKIVRPGGQLIGIGVLAALTVLAGVHIPTTGWALVWVLPFIPVFGCASVLLWRKVLPAGSGQHKDTKGSGSRTDTPGHDDISAKPTMRAVKRAESIGREFWRFTAPRAVASGAQTALQRVDVLLVASLAGLVPAAAYAVAGRFIVVGQLTNGAISQAVQPRLAEMLAVGDRAAANRLYQVATAWLVLVSWPLHLLVLQYSDVYLGAFGSAYADAAPAVKVLAAAMLIGTGCGMVDIVLSMAGRTTWNLLNVLLALAVMIGIDLYTVPRLGALGAAIGLAAAVIVNNLLPLAQLTLSLRLHPFGPATRTAMVLAGLCFGLVPWLARQTTFNLALGPILGFACYLAGLRLLAGRLELSVIIAARRLRAR